VEEKPREHQEKPREQPARVEAESIQPKLKPRVSSSRNRRESPTQGETKRVQPKKKPREPEV